MDPNESDCLTQMRLLHYPASDNAVGTWRAGVHTDIGCLTLLFQRTGEDGLEIRPGRESSDTFAFGSEFTPLPAETGLIVVNIGDMLSKFTASLMERESTKHMFQWRGQMTVLRPTSTESEQRKWGSLLIVTQLPTSTLAGRTSTFRGRKRSSKFHCAQKCIITWLT